MKNHQLMSFPKSEWADIAKQLEKVGCCSSTRCCYQLGKYKKGDVYITPWGDTIEIIKVTRYLKPEDIPTWNLMDKGMKISVRKGKQFGNSQWDHVIFKKIN